MCVCVCWDSGTPRLWAAHLKKPVSLSVSASFGRHGFHTAVLCLMTMSLTLREAAVCICQDFMRTETDWSLFFQT